MIGVGGYFLIAERDKPGGFTLGTLIMFRAYWWRLFGPVQTLARVNDMVQRAVAAGKRVFEVLDAPDELPDRKDATPITNVRGELELRNVTFAYPTDQSAIRNPQSAILPPVLQDLNIRIPPGKTIALCGPSGSGKSTILNLLLRFYDPTQGQVMLDGHDLREIRREGLRRHFALVQ